MPSPDTVIVTLNKSPYKARNRLQITHIPLPLLPLTHAWMAWTPAQQGLREASSTMPQGSQAWAGGPPFGEDPGEALAAHLTALG